MTIDLRYILPSPPCRAIMILAKQLGIDLNLINVNLWDGSNQSDEFIKINPRKLVPVINDNGFVLSESRAILTYLINQYAPGHALYPTDAKKRADIDRVLFLTSELWEKFRAMAKPLFDSKKWPPTEESEKNYFEVLRALELLTANRNFLAGDEMSIADISFACDLTELTDVLGIKIHHVAPGIASWLERMKTALPEYEELISKPVDEFKKMVKEMFGDIF